MCDAVSLSVREIPSRYLNHPAVQARLAGRGGEEEVQFYFERKPYPPLLPILLDEQFRIVRWGNRTRRSQVLPALGRVPLWELEQGVWQHADIQEIVIVANAALHRGVWFPVLEGIRGIFLRDERGTPTAYMLMDKPTDYYRIMTKASLMPVLLGEVI